MIFDGHTHYFSTFRGLRGLAIDEFVAGLERQGVGGTALLTLEGFVREDSRHYNDELHAAAQTRPDFLYPFCTVHPRDGKKAIDEMRRCALELGMRGVKFHPWLQAFCASSEDVFPFVEAAIDLKIPLLFHDGTPPYSGSLQVAYLARRYPEATIILGHSGLRDLWREALFAALKYPNIILQFCGAPVIAMREMVRQVGAARCVFGSDYPFPGEGSLEVAARQIKELELDAPDEQAILNDNFRRLLKI